MMEKLGANVVGGSTPGRTIPDDVCAPLDGVGWPSGDYREYVE